MKKMIIFLVLCLFIQFSPAEALTTYTVTTMRRSHWALDSVAGTFLYHNGKPYRGTGTGIYTFQRTLNPAKTAIVCMDCWRDMADPILEAHFHAVTEAVIYPLMLETKNAGFTNVILTNDPAITPYNYGVDPSLVSLNANVLYHTTYDNPLQPLAFYNWLSSRGIDTLVYVGFASNACIASRMSSLFYMGRYFKVYFVPDASAATENLDNWDGHIHANMTEIISKQFEIFYASQLIDALR
jgi:hypothetical protein